MKMRADFVTNSSSSSFILARKDELTEKQKVAIINYVETHMLGKEMLTPASTEEEIQQLFDDIYMSEDDQEEVRKALKEDMTIFGGWVSYEDCECEYTDMFQSLWRELEEVNPKEFETIYGDLDY